MMGETPGGDLGRRLSVVDTGKPSLAHLSVVDKLVRDFVGSVLVVKSAFDSGKGAREPLPLIEERAQEAGDIILGRNDAYDAQEWNAPYRLGARLKVEIPNECIHYGEPGKALFMWLAAQVLRASKAIKNGEVEERVHEQLGEVMDSAVALIMGIR